MQPPVFLGFFQFDKKHRGYARPAGGDSERVTEEINESINEEKEIKLFHPHCSDLEYRSNKRAKSITTGPLIVITS